MTSMNGVLLAIFISKPIMKKLFKNVERKMVRMTHRNITFEKCT